MLYTMYRFLFVFQETEFFLKRIKIRLSIAACILDDDDKNKFFQDSLVGRFAETAYHQQKFIQTVNILYSVIKLIE